MEREKKAAGAFKWNLKAAALFLCGVLLGGLCGGAAAFWLERRDTGAASASAAAAELSDAELYEACVGSVVGIDCAKSFDAAGEPDWTGAHGSGAVLTADGFILTNSHVVREAKRIRVKTYADGAFPARLIGCDDDVDIAVLKIEADALAPVKTNVRPDIRVGDPVRIIGCPLGDLTFTMSGGMLSCAERTVAMAGREQVMMQTDASINPGNSGGPMFNKQGQLVGIVAAKYADYEGLGFAIPVKDALAAAERIRTADKGPERTGLGVLLDEAGQGAVVADVQAGSPAEKAGLQAGDVIVAVNGWEITSAEELEQVLSPLLPGDTIVLRYRRERKNCVQELKLEWAFDGQT